MRTAWNKGLKGFRKGENAGVNNGMWKGDGVGYIQLHVWVRSRLPKSELCERCKKVAPYDLANKGAYNRELKNWEWLCRKCHMTKDKRLTKLKKTQFVKGQGNWKTRKRNQYGKFMPL